MYFGGKEQNAISTMSQLSELRIQVTALATQVSQISVALAKPPTLPENVAYKADLLRLCVENRQLKCPPY
jgi:hypothetical protein